MIKKRKKLFVKLGVLFVSLFACILTLCNCKTYAYTYAGYNNIVYSDNALPFINPEKVIASNTYQFINYYSYDEQQYIFTYSNNYYFDSFRISLYSGNTDNDYVSLLYSSTSLNELINNIQVSLFNGKTLNYCKTNYSNYRIRFLVRSVNNGSYEYSYLQFNCGAMFDYWLQFKDGNTTFSNYVLTCGFSARYSTQDLTHFYLFSQCGFYCGNSSAIDYYNYYGENGVYRNNWNDEQYESYQNEILQLQENNRILVTLNKSLQEQVNDSIGWQSLFFSMADTPFKTISNALGFDVLGINLYNVLIGFLTLLAIMYCIKKILF